MNSAEAQHYNANPVAAPMPPNMNASQSSQQAPGPSRMTTSLPPPSPLEPPTTHNQGRTQTQPIMNETGQTPPGYQSPAPAPQAFQPHPNTNRGISSPKESRDLKQAEQYKSLAGMIKSSDPATVRQVLRDHWGQCFVGSEYHTAFTLNATLHQATPATLSRAVLDFGGKLVSTAKAQILEHFEPSDFDEVADVILTRVSTKFQDRVLAQRVETIDAKSLVNTLARAERLGFSVDDVLDERPVTNGSGKTEQVIPSLKGIPLQQLQQPQQQPQASPSISQGSNGLVHCGACNRPCSGRDALNYHSKKAACDPDFNYENVGTNICPHCGCSFGSSGGLNYHIKGEVCGTYNEDATRDIHGALKSFVQGRAQRKQNGWAQTPYAGAVTPVAAPKYGQSNQTMSASHHQSPRPPGSTTQATKQDAYKHLTPETLARFRHDMTNAEETYGQKMRDAMLLPEPESTDRIARHKNAYNAKVSTTRKRYGIRLRERRSKEEVDAERIRLLRRPDAPDIWLEQERKAREMEKFGKRPFDGANGPGFVNTGQSTFRYQTQPQPQQQGPPQVDSPRKRVPLSEMGGLSGSAGSAEVVDPTAYQAPSSQPRGFAQVQQQQSASQVNMANQGTRGEPMMIDSNNNSDIARSQDGSGTETDSSDDDDDDEDIPAA